MKIVFNSVIPINTFCQTYENEIINRGTNGVMSVSNLIPPQLKEFVQSFGMYRALGCIEFWVVSSFGVITMNWCTELLDTMVSSNLGEVCLLTSSNASVKRKNSRGKRILDNALATSPKALYAKLFHESLLNKMPETWNTLARKHILQAVFCSMFH
jgi:hypothetical protein